MEKPGIFGQDGAGLAKIKGDQRRRSPEQERERERGVAELKMDEGDDYKVLPASFSPPSPDRLAGDAVPTLGPLPPKARGKKSRVRMASEREGGPSLSPALLQGLPLAPALLQSWG